MKCPFMIANVPLAMKEEEPTIGDCLKEECAWWNENLGTCDPTGLTTYFIALGSVVGRIHDELCLSKHTYRCHYCGVTIERTASGGSTTPGSWTRAEQLDGKFAWLCDQCSDQGK